MPCWRLLTKPSKMVEIFPIMVTLLVIQLLSGGLEKYKTNSQWSFQVQLRLQQVVSAPSDRREDLLKELEHFAFRGIPNVSSPRPPDAVAAENLEKIDQIEDKSLQQVFTLFEPRNFLPTLCWFRLLTSLPTPMFTK